jgi:hypothetical protein
MLTDCYFSQGEVPPCQAGVSQQSFARQAIYYSEYVYTLAFNILVADKHRLPAATQ